MKTNIFTILIVVFTFAIVMRLFDLADFSIPVSVAEGTTASKKLEQVSEQPPGPLPEKEAPSAPAADPKALPAQSPYGEPTFSATELDVLQSLAKRRAELDVREKQIGMREALLKAAEVEVDRKVSELNKIKTDLETLLGKQQSVQQARVDSLIKIYGGMKPKEAARIFDTLEMDILLAVIGKMDERKSSPIIASMDPEKARLITVRLLEQHMLPGQGGDSKKDTPASAAAP